MSAESPAIRGKTADESPSSVRSLPPVTPGVKPDGFSAYNESPAEYRRLMPKSAAGESYFDPKAQAGPDSPAKVAGGADTSQDLLRRISLPTASDAAKEFANANPRARYPNLNLSGRIISATFVVPYNIKLSQTGEWNLDQRKGTSALFDHFSYLYSDDAPWDHVLVGWTGEITKESTVRTTFKVSDLTDELKALLSASLPVPIDGKTKASNQYFGPQGVSLSTQDRKNLENLLEKQQGGRVVPVWLNDSTSDSDNFYLKDQRRWCRFSEHELYSLFHYKQNEPTDGHDVKKFWIDYYKMNKMFADRIMEVYKPGDIVIVHDHQLLLLPALLRQRIPSIFVGFFLHIPFPSSELYRCLTQRKELLEGILGANMVGFQSYSYSRHFSSCCTRILGFDSSSVGVDAYGAHVAVDVFPIGIDAQSILTAAFEDPVVDEKMASIRKLYAGKKLIVGRDRMDSIRGVAQKLQAFEMFLDNYPEWQDKVVLVQITSSSDRNPEQDASDKKYVNKIGDLVAKINGTFGSLSHAPVQHFPQYLSKEEYLALLRVADLGLITSVRDGMNTTSMEYVICQRDNHGPLILSEFSGTAGSLSDAIHVNPWDLHSVAESINRALLLSDEAKKSQHDKLYNYVTKNNIRTWTDKFINRLLTNLSSYDQSMATPVLDRARILEQYQTAKKRLFMFDYDGTLTPIVKDPLAALPSDRVLRTLKTLAGDPNNHVWIISGRDQAFLEEWMGHISPLGLSAEHGAFMRYPHEDSWINVAEGLDMSWREEVQKIFQHYTERTQGSVIEVKKIALTWHYRGADPDYATHQAHACQKELEAKVAKKWDVEVMNGKANLEVRPKVTNKGEIAKRLIEMYGIDELGLVLCLGDDYTDEDMFHSIRRFVDDERLQRPKAFPVTVGASSKNTLAYFHLLEPADVLNVLGLLNGDERVSVANAGAVSVLEGPEIIKE